MSTNTLSSQGVKLYRSALGGASFTEVTQVVNIGDVGSESALEDVTTLTSALREYRKQIPEGMELEIEVIFDPQDAMHATTLRDDQASPDPVTFAVEYPTSPETYDQFDAIVMRYAKQVQIDESVRLLAGLKITGAITQPASITKA